LARAEASPDRTRSRINSRSNSAMLAPHVQSVQIRAAKAGALGPESYFWCRLNPWRARPLWLW